jgi:thiol-disulfide isomerase/thioredoxin
MLKLQQPKGSDNIASFFVSIQVLVLVLHLKKNHLFMKKHLFLLFLLSNLFVLNILAQKTVKVVKKEDLLDYIQKEDGKAKVINFWATWCKPCILELPHFEEVKKKYAGKDIEFVLVSLDFSKDLQTKVIPFVNRKKLAIDVWLLDESNPDTWIDQLNPDWQGDIPATLFIQQKKGVKSFEAKEFTLEELEQRVKELF